MTLAGQNDVGRARHVLAVDRWVTFGPTVLLGQAVADGAIGLVVILVGVTACRRREHGRRPEVVGESARWRVASGAPHQNLMRR